MSDQPKVTSDPIEPEPVGRRRIVMPRAWKKALATMVTIVFCWAAYKGNILAGWLLFPVIILWNWAVPGRQADCGAYRARRKDPLDSYSLGSLTGTIAGPQSAAGALDYERRQRDIEKP